MKYDFDRVIDRANTGAVKWDRFNGGSNAGPIDPITAGLKGDGPIPMWVADMDFVSPQPVVDALAERATHGVFGYTVADDSYYDSIIDWFQRRHNWTIERDWIITAPGVVPALEFAIKTFCEPGDKVLVQRPVYYPFFRVIEHGGCEIVSNTLVENAGVYEMDFEDLEAKAADPKARIAILCSPHNPIGRVWTQDELRRFAEICTRNGVMVISDEIHCDLIMPGHRFQPYGTVGEEFADNSIITTAASKTFNVAGLHLSNIIIKNPDIREKYQEYMVQTGVAGGLTPFGLIGTEASYRGGEDWLAQVLDYIQANYDHLKSELARRMPSLTVSPLEGTFLAWIDFRKLGLDRAGLEDLAQVRAKVLFDEGYIFGDEGDGFERMNIACSRAVLDLALDRLEKEVKALA
ncbi:MAG: pyridoxal phosphate-dependent aminotransferase [Rhodospirillaceae bacterium]|jgi:cysteine-S-conjugate beta-lyase|nr:pyridoxal phosphate-dependent aminotransferase [Rhodospirillaceae bacterium]